MAKKFQVSSKPSTRDAYTNIQTWLACKQINLEGSITVFLPHKRYGLALPDTLSNKEQEEHSVASMEIVVSPKGGQKQKITLVPHEGSRGGDKAPGLVV